MYNMTDKVGDLEIQTRNVRGVWLTEFRRDGHVVSTVAATTSPSRAHSNHLWVVKQQQNKLSA